MVKIPERVDPTLAAADKAMEAAQRWRPRPYLGMSGIGRECERQIFYEYRWALPVKHNAHTLKRFADGDAAEIVAIKRLRMAEGVTLLAVDPKTGYQFAMNDFGDHYKGHADGLIIGLLQAPKTMHVFECKASEKYGKLVELKRKFGEKAALKEWNATYFAQAQMYCHYLECDRHYLVCIDAGSRDWVSIRTEYNKQYAEQLVKKAERIIFAQNPPERVSEDPCFYLCRWCAYSELCHEGSRKFNMNCRTCLHSTPLREGGWHCAKHDQMLDYDMQFTGCNHHLLIPSLLNAEQIDAAEDGSWIAYRLPDGQEWLDGNRDSREIYEDGEAK